MLRKLVFTMIAFSGLVVSVHAGETVGERFDKYRTSEAVRYALGEAGDAYSWANARLSNQNQQRLYCQPAKLGMTSDQYWAIFEGYLQRHPEIRADPATVWNYVLLNALQETFPCM